MRKSFTRPWTSTQREKSRAVPVYSILDVILHLARMRHMLVAPPLIMLDYVLKTKKNKKKKEKERQEGCVCEMYMSEKKAANTSENINFIIILYYENNNNFLSFCLSVFFPFLVIAVKISVKNSKVSFFLLSLSLSISLFCFTQITTHDTEGYDG